MSLTLTRKDSTVLSKTAAEVLDILAKLKLSGTDSYKADSVLYYALDPSTLLVLDCAWNFNELVRQLYTFAADPEKEWGFRCHYESGGLTTLHSFREALTNRGFAGAGALDDLASAYGWSSKRLHPKRLTESTTRAKTRRFSRESRSLTPLCLGSRIRRTKTTAA